MPRKPRKHWPLSKLLPNLVTMAALICGMSAVRFATLERWELAIAFIVGAAILDAMDGMVARMLKATSTFGAQLDSLSDIVCFGVAPALVVYLWKLHEIKGLGWAIVLFFTVCCALRLARFNTAMVEEEHTDTVKKQRHFTGVPAPAGALLSMLPMVLAQQLGFSFFNIALLNALYVPVIAVLMASRIPTFSLKGIRVRHDRVLPVMLGLGFGIVIFIIEPWTVLACIGVVYLGSLLVTLLRYRHWSAKEAPAPTPSEASEE